jgi:hypothetical protein
MRDRITTQQFYRIYCTENLTGLNNQPISCWFRIKFIYIIFFFTIFCLYLNLKLNYTKINNLKFQISNNYIPVKFLFLY